MMITFVVGREVTLIYQGPYINLYTQMLRGIHSFLQNKIWQKFKYLVSEFPQCFTHNVVKLFKF